MKKPANKLTAAWYKKLLNDGYRDIEIWGTNYEQDFPELLPDSQNYKLSKYYVMASDFYYSEEWKDKVDKEIWELHTNRNSNKEISKKTGLKDIKVARIVSKYSKVIERALKEIGENNEQ